MSQELTQARIDELLSQDENTRLNYTVKTIAAENTIWILTDEHGAVMLNTEDEDCVPVWPNEEFAMRWATDDWKTCKPLAVSFNKWQSRWTQGLMDDELSLVVFPNENEQGLVLFPDEFEQEVSKAKRKR